LAEKETEQRGRERLEEENMRARTKATNELV
jgi:hypothetical protein